LDGAKRYASAKYGLECQMPRFASLIIIIAMTVGLASSANAGAVRPWAPGEDVDAFSREYCSAVNLERHYFPAMDGADLAKLNYLVSELLWFDFSDYLLGVTQNSTEEVVARFASMKRPVSKPFRALVELGRVEPLRSKYVYFHNQSVEKRRDVLRVFEAIARSDARLGAALLTYSDCRFVRNVKELDPYLARRAEKVATIKLPVVRSQTNSSQDGGITDPGCECGGGNFCYGPRGGHYCITSGGKRDYVPH
jgi:hypothetical protein